MRVVDRTSPQDYSQVTQMNLIKEEDNRWMRYHALRQNT